MSAIADALHALGFSKSPPPSDQGSRTPGQPLVPGQFYRVWTKVDEAYVVTIYDAAPPTFGQTAVQDQLALDLTHHGFAHPLLVVQDPSDAMVWTMLARWQPRDPSLRYPLSSGPIHFTRFDPVEEPARASPRVNVPSLDAGLSEDDLYLLCRVLSTDNDPKRLAGLARCFDEDFPIAASLLRNKARLENLNRCVNLETGPLRVEDRHNDRPGPMSDTDHPTLQALKGSLRDLGDVTDHLDDYANAFHTCSWTSPEAAAAQGDDAMHAFEPELASLEPAESAIAFGKLLTLLSRTPSLAQPKNLAALTTKTGEPRALVAAAIAATSNHGNGIATFDPVMVRALRPQGPRPLSLGALKMAHAVLRPEGSLAAAPGELSDVLTDLHASVRKGDPMAIKAEESMKRARRYLDRQNWTAWVRRYQEAEAV